MRKDLRDFFKAERQRRGLNQTKVAELGGLTQGMVSRIEIEPEYEPSIEVLEKAVKGLGMTLSAFFAQIEGLPMAERPAQDQNVAVPLIGFDDDALSTLAPKVLLRIVVALAKAVAAREREASSREHRGHHAEARTGEAGPDHRARSDRARGHKGRVKAKG